MAFDPSTFGSALFGLAPPPKPPAPEDTPFQAFLKQQASRKKPAEMQIAPVVAAPEPISAGVKFGLLPQQVTDMNQQLLAEQNAQINAQQVNAEMAIRQQNANAAARQAELSETSQQLEIAKMLTPKPREIKLQQLGDTILDMGDPANIGRTINSGWEGATVRDDGQYLTTYSKTGEVLNVTERQMTDAENQRLRLAADANNISRSKGAGSSWRPPPVQEDKDGNKYYVYQGPNGQPLLVPATGLNGEPAFEPDPQQQGAMISVAKDNYSNSVYAELVPLLNVEKPGSALKVWSEIALADGTKKQVLNEDALMQEAARLAANNPDLQAKLTAAAQVRDNAIATVDQTIIANRQRAAELLMAEQAAAEAVANQPPVAPVATAMTPGGESLELIDGDVPEGLTPVPLPGAVAPVSAPTPPLGALLMPPRPIVPGVVPPQPIAGPRYAGPNGFNRTQSGGFR